MTASAADSLGPSGQTKETDKFTGEQDFTVSSGDDIGEYVGSAHGPINFRIWLPFRGAVDSYGHPATIDSTRDTNFYINKTVKLTVHAWDVDEQCEGCLNPATDLREVDTLVVNGTPISGQLHGSNEVWSDTTFEFPATLLRFQSTWAGPQDGENDFQVLVDTLGASHWMVEIGSASIELPSRESARPVVYLHGLGPANGDQTEMVPIKDQLQADAESLGYPGPGGPAYIIPTYGGVANLDALDQDWSSVWSQVQSFLTKEKAEGGWTQVDVVGHSFGGLIAREFASKHPDDVRTVVMIGTPNGGVGPADAWCWGFGSWCQPGAIRDIQTGTVRDVINKQIPDNSAVYYFSLGGKKDDGCAWPGVWTYSETNDGCVPEASAQWLVAGEGNGANGIEMGGPDLAEFDTDHAQETSLPRDGGGNGTPWFREMSCLILENGNCPAPFWGLNFQGVGAASKASPNVRPSLVSGASTIDTSLIVDQTVQPGATAHVPVAFEGSSQAEVDVSTSGAPLTATIGSTALVVSQGLFGFTLDATLANPVDGTLNITNAGTSPASFRALVTIQTHRHLSLAVGSLVANRGAAVPIDLQLSQPSVGDSPTAFFVDAAGSHTDIPLTSVGSGEWTGTLSSNVVGEGMLFASVNQNGARYASAPVTTSSGYVSASGISEQRIDTDGDGLANELALATNVSVQTQGTYLVTGQLTTQSGAAVATATAEASLVSGSQGVILNFPGAAMYASGQSGPYQLAVTVVNETGAANLLELAGAAVGSTTALDYKSFQHRPVGIDQSSLAVHGVDADGNGFFEGLTLTGSVSVDTDGSYVIQAGLNAPNGTQITRALVVQPMSPGSNSFTLSFDGPTIWKAGLDGPYTITDLSVALSDDSASDLLTTAITTPPYTAHQFTPPPASAVAPTISTTTRTSSISVPFTATFPGGAGSVEVWDRYTPDGGTAGAWEMAGSGSQSPISVPLTHGEGTYELRTRALDALGQAEAQHQTTDQSVVYSLTLPTSSIGTLPPVITDGRNLVIPVSATDNGTGVQSVEIWMRCHAPGSTDWTTWGQYYDQDPGPGYSVWVDCWTNGNTSGDGTFEFYSVALDNQGRREPSPASADATTILDTATPTSNAGALPSRVTNTTLTIPFHADDWGGSGIASVELWESFNGGIGGPYHLVATTSQSPFVITLDQGAGNYKFHTIAVDSAGHREGPPTGYFFEVVWDCQTDLDTGTPPLTSAIVQPANGTITKHEISLDYWAAYPSGSGSVELWQRSEPAGDSSFGPWTLARTNATWPIDLTFDVDGRYEFYTIAIDSGGTREVKPQAEEASVLVDTQPPVVSIDALPAVSTDPTITLTCHASDLGAGVSSSYFVWRLLDDPYMGDTGWNGTGQSCSPSATFTMPINGHYQFAITATDNLGQSTVWPPTPLASTYFDGPPVSHAYQIDPPTRKSDLGMWVPVVSNDPFEVWARYEPFGGSTFTPWVMLGTDYPSTFGTGLGFNYITYQPQFTHGEGRYEYYSVAFDPVTGVREAPPLDQVPPAAAQAYMLYDYTKPTSAFTAQAPLRVGTPTITLPFSASDAGIGVAITEGCFRYRATQDQAWSSWQCGLYDAVSDLPSGTMDVSLTNGEGFYEFATQATDKAGNYEPRPTTAQTWTHYTTGGDPGSSILALPAFTNSTTFTVPYIADFASGGGSVDLYERYQAKGGSTFTSWAKVATTTYPNALVAPLTQGDGRYEFYTVATDGQSAVAEADAATADGFTVLDTVPPTSSITSGSGWTSYPAAYVGVSSTDDVSGISRVDFHYQFKPVGGSSFGPWKPLASDGDNCYGDYSNCSFYRNLTDGDGSYNIASIAIDGAGNAEPGPSVVKATVMVDSVAPTVSITPLPAAVKSSYVSITYAAADNIGGSGVYQVLIYQRSQDPATGTWSDWGYVKTATSSPTSVAISGDGRHEYYAFPFDNAGNCPDFAPVAQAFTVLDKTPPTSQAGPLTSPTSASSVDVPYTASDAGTGVASVDLYRRFTAPNGSPGSYTKVATVTSAASSGTFNAVALPSGDGTYDFYTRATDVVGNVEVAPSTFDATIVRSSPTPASYVSPSTAAYQKTSPLQVPWVVTANGGGLASVELWYRYTAPGVTPSGSYTKSANTYTGSATSGTFSYTASSDGTYEFYTIAVATNGNREAAPPPATPDATAVLDKVVPTSTTNALTSPTRASTVDVTYNASDNTNGSGLASVELWERFTVPGGTPSGSYALILTNPGNASPQKFTGVATAADGRYEFYTISVDKAGNRKATPSAAEAFTVRDTAAPSSSASSPAATKAATISITYAINDAGGSGPASIQLWRRYTVVGATPSGAYTLVTTTTSTAASGTFANVALSADGRYEFYSIATDAAGNVETVPGSAKITVTRDQVLPSSSAGPLASLINSTALSVPYTASDTNGSGVATVDLYQSYEAAGSTTWSSYAKVGSPGTGTSGSISITLGLGAGLYRFYTIATDAAGNVEAAPSTSDATTVLDVTAPTSSLTTVPPSTSSAASISIAYTASDNTNGSGLASVECWSRFKASDGLTPGAWTTCGTAATSSGSFTLTFSSGTGLYDILTVAVDKAGNREAAIANPPAAGATPKGSVRSVTWAGSGKVNTDTGTALQDNAAYAVGSDGTVYAVWEDSRNGNTDIYFSSRNPSTGVWATETKLNTDTGTTGQRTPSIAIDGSNNLYVVWADDRNGATNTDIYFAKRTGTTWSANIKVNSDTATAVQSNPRIAVNPAGIAVAVWYDARSSQVNIYSARLAAGSTTWSTNYSITTSNTSAVKAAPDVAVATDGTAWAAWQDNRTGGGDIYVASLGPTATAWSTNTKVSDDSGTSSLDKSARIGLTSANLPVVAYLDGRATTAAVRVSNRTSGGTWNATVQVSDSLSKPATGLALAVKADGGIIVAWEDTRVTATAIWGAQCEAGSGTSSVTRCGPTEKWSDQTGASTHPTIVASTSKVYLGWRDDTAGGGDIRIRLRNPS